MTNEHGSTRRTLLFTAGAVALLAGIGILPRLAARAGTTHLGAPGDVTIEEFDAAGKSLATRTVAKVVKTEEEWRAQLSPLAFEVTRQEGTEQSFTGPWLDVHEAGTFRCVCCGTALFSSATKYNSGTGWPSFFEPHRQGQHPRHRGPELRHAARGQFLRPLRGASRPRLQRRPAADRPPLLHERRRARFRAARRRLNLHQTREDRAMTAPRRKFSTDRVIPWALAGLLALPIVALVSQTGFVGASAAEEAVKIPPPALDAKAGDGLATAVVAGGCFWGVQAVFQHVDGVESAVSGYSGGHLANPDYHAVTTGTTGHAEAVEIKYDPARVSYGKLLQIFFSVAHNPTELNRQGPDVGTQYRSAIYVTDAEQATVAKAYIDAARRGRRVSRGDRYRSGAARRVLRGGGLSSGLRDAPSRPALHLL